ncbi:MULTISPECIES: sce7726 family protein [unclassified Clostridium]|uniref:sce7726 family protein n=1 Tax=unclassified Clostridium TaxID=2614128 RepID=UPI0032179127
MGECNNLILNKLFTKSTFKNLIEKNRSDVYTSIIKQYVNDSDSKYNELLIREIYKVITKTYRNEYFYKNTLLNKLLLGRHSLKTTTALTEIPINKSKADFVLINGKAIVYEIKTELDTFDRLGSQLNDYYKAFNNVCVVTCESNYKKLSDILKNSNVGICILTDKNTLSTRREPIEDNSKLNHKTMFKILRKREFENILLQQFGVLPIVDQVFYYDECFELFQKIDIESAYQYMIKELKQRNKIEIEEYKHYVPYELKFLIYFSNFKKGDYIKLNDFLKNKFGG